MSLLVRMRVGWSIGKGNQASQRGDLATAINRYRDARDYAIAKNSLGDAIMTGMLLADELKTAGDIEASETEFERVAIICNEVERFTFAGRVLHGSEMELESLEALVDIAVDAGDDAKTRERLELLLAAAARHQNRPLAATTMARLGDAWRQLSDHSAAQQMYRNAATELAGLADVRGQAAVYRSWARSAELTDDREQALRLYDQALVYYRLVGDVPNQANGHGQLGDIRCALGDVSGARVEYEAAVELFREAADKEGEARALHLLRKLDKQHSEQGESTLANQTHPTIREEPPCSP